MNKSKQQKMAAFSEEFLIENDFEVVLSTSVVMTMVPTLLRQLRRPLHMKKIISSAPYVL